MLKTISESKCGRRKMVVIIYKDGKKKGSRTIHLREKLGKWYGAKGPDYWTLCDYGKTLPDQDLVEVK